MSADNLPRPASDALVSDILDSYRDDEGSGEDVRRLAARIEQDRRRINAVRALCERVLAWPAEDDRTPIAQGSARTARDVLALLAGKDDDA